MENTKWDNFFDEKIKQIFETKKDIIDIGGGLRVSKTKGNRCNPKRSWIIPYLDKVNYKILDPVPDYNPDIIGDIHNLPFADNSIDAILCIAVLEHVTDPFKACEEMYRVLKKGGHCFIYTPFLYGYHADPGYYEDYWRFTETGLKHLCRNFSVIETQNVRGALEAWLFISPLNRFKIILKIAGLIDRLTKKNASRQTGGYYMFLTK